MKYRSKKFKTKLWVYFAVFAAAIFAVLWVLQIVLLQFFYDSSVIHNTEKAAEEISVIYLSQHDDDTWTALDSIAYDYSLLLIITDMDGSIIYSTDEHSAVYNRKNHSYTADDDATRSSNPYMISDEPLSWQLGRINSTALPDEYGALLEKLGSS